MPQNPEHTTYADRMTGRTVHQVTSHRLMSHPTYFLQPSFTPDNRTLIFTSYRTGSAELFEADFPDGEIRRLTSGRPIHPFSPAILPDGRVLFVRGGEVWCIDRTDLTEQRIFAFEGAQLGECSFSPDGAWIVAAYQHASARGLVVGRVDGTGWRNIVFPRTCIHPQFHPLEPEWIEFSADPAPRMHRVRRDGSHLECLYEHGNDYFIVHETFLGITGDLVFTVWPRSLRRMDWTSGRVSQITEFNAWHIAPSRDGEKVLCDTNHPDKGIFLINARTGERTLVCLSESSNQGSQWKKTSYALAEDFQAARSDASRNLSWMESAVDTVYGPQWTHPHPSFSPDEKMVAFASDRTGITQVYVTELDFPPARATKVEA